MALVKEIMGCPRVLEKSVVFLNSSNLIANRSRGVMVPTRRKSLQLRRSSRVPAVVAAISEKNLVKLPLTGTETEKAVQFKVRAVLTVKNKDKEDLKGTLVKHLDAITDKIGRNVVLQLVSTEIDPSNYI